MQLARANCATRAVGAAPLKRVAGLPVLARPACLRQIGSRIVTRATDPSSASEAAAAALDKAAAAATDAAAKAKETASAAASKLKGAINQATLDVDIKQLLQYNFLAQLVLTAVSWAVVFLTSHVGMAKGSSLNPTVLVLMIGVALAGYSAYLSFGYLAKSKNEGLGALDGWDMLNKFYEHATFNFIGCIATMTALMANVGTLMVKKGGSLALEALAQAASNTLLAHLVSLAFLMVMTRKITQAYQKLAAWGEQLDQLKASMPRLG